MAEEILIEIKLEKGDNEAAVDAMTQKITNLTKANKDLEASNKALAKAGQENSKEYLENSRQIEINKQKITEATASRKGLIESILAEDDSIKALKIRNAELIKQRDQLSASTAIGRQKIAEINAELNKNNATINENSSALEKQKFNIGNYKSGLDGIVPGLGGMVTGIQNATKAGLAFIATPIGLVIAAIGAALFALTSYFKGSEEGQNNLNKVMAVGSAIMEKFMDVVEAAGKVIFDAISNPKQAIIDFGNLVKENIINRFEGILEFIPEIGKSIDLLFQGKFTEAATVAFDATAKVVTGVENASSKIAGFVTEVGTMVDQAIENGKRLADIQEKIDKDERALIVERQKSALEVAKLKEQAVTEEGDLKRKTIQEAIALEEELSKKEVEFAKTRLALAQEKVRVNGDDKEALKAQAEAQAGVFAAETTAFTNTLKLRKQLQTLDEDIAKEKTQQAEDQRKLDEEQFNNNIKILDDGHTLRLQSIKEQYLNELISKDQFEAQFAVIEKTALEDRRAFLVANGQETLAIDQQLLDLKLKQMEAANAKDLAASKTLSNEKVKQQQAEARGQRSLVDGSLALAKEAFGENKAIAAAETIINTIRGITRAIADYPFPYSAIVAGLVGAIGTIQTTKILGITFGRGGIPTTGGVLQGRSHAQGGIPFTVGGQSGFEAEGGEAIINKRSTAMYKPLLSQINQAGGGIAFAAGGVTRQAAQSADASLNIRQAVSDIMSQFPPIVVTVEDINAKQGEVNQTQSTVQVI